MSKRILRSALVLLAGLAPVWAAASGTGSTIPGDVPEEVVPLVAEGYGSASRGGEGGREIWVTNLNDHGRGSLRKALMATRPRIIRFRVGGTIKLEKSLVATSGRVTLDGLSAAPHGGITIEGGLGFNVSQKVVIAVEYRYLNLDYKNGKEGAEFFAFDGNMNGPMFGVGIRF